MSNKAPRKSSGKFVLRLSTTLHRRLRDKAFEEGISLNQICLNLIEAGISNDHHSSCYKPFQQIEAKAIKKYGDDFIGMMLFGSIARGDDHEESDTDLMIVLSSNIQIVRSLYDDWNDEFEDHFSLHLTHLPLQTEDAGSLWLECALDGRIISDRQGQLSRVISKIKERITSGKVIRKTTHGQGYWITV